MLIGLCGPTCAGMQSVVDYLIHKYGFRALKLQETYKYDSTASTLEENSALISGGDLYFQNIEALDIFVSKRWQELWIVKNLRNEVALDLLLRRPFFLLISVDAPVTTRWARFRRKPNQNPDDPSTLERFVEEDDDRLYGKLGLAYIMGRAQLRLLNSSNSIQALHRNIDLLDLINEQRLRPSWDQYFMELASLAAQRSNCMRRRVGCVIVRDKRVISTGYNGTPRNLTNCNEAGCPRCNGAVGGGAALSTCLCMHAEENALLEAGRERIREGAILYCDTCPCLTCSIKIVQVGISEVVYSQSYHMDVETARVFREAGVHLRQFSPPRNGLVDLSIES